MKLLQQEFLDYEDVSIRPKSGHDYILSRKDVNVYKNEPDFKNGKVLPIMASNMAHTGTFEMAKALSSIGALTCIHKFYDVEDLAQFFCSDEASENTFYTMGIREEDFTKFKKVSKRMTEICNLQDQTINGQTMEVVPTNVLIDVANGYLNQVEDLVKSLKDIYPCVKLMVGNVATAEGVSKLAKAGADIVRCGISSGSVCTTRKVTGVGVPMFTMAMECVEAGDHTGVQINLDGGCKVPGDVVKALGVGGDFVTLGGMLAGHDECSGNIIQNGDEKYKEFYGMSSYHAMKNHGMDSDHRVAEGKMVRVPYRGTVLNTMREIIGGIQSACSYSGVDDLEKLHDSIEFIKVRRQWNTIFEK